MMREGDEARGYFVESGVSLKLTDFDEYREIKEIAEEPATATRGPLVNQVLGRRNGVDFISKRSGLDRNKLTDRPVALVDVDDMTQYNFVYGRSLDLGLIVRLAMEEALVEARREFFVTDNIQMVEWSGDETLLLLPQSMNEDNAEEFLNFVREQTMINLHRRLGVARITNFEGMDETLREQIMVDLGLPVSDQDGELVVLFDVKADQTPEQAWQAHISVINQNLGRTHGVQASGRAEGYLPSFSVSMGMTRSVPNEDPQRVLRAVEEGLQSAKSEEGKNRVVRSSIGTSTAARRERQISDRLMDRNEFEDGLRSWIGELNKEQKPASLLVFQLGLEMRSSFAFKDLIDVFGRNTAEEILAIVSNGLRRELAGKSIRVDRRWMAGVRESIPVFLLESDKISREELGEILDKVNRRVNRELGISIRLFARNIDLVPVIEEIQEHIGQADEQNVRLGIREDITNLYEELPYISQETTSVSKRGHAISETPLARLLSH